MRSAVEWAKVRARDADGVSHRQIARRLGINPRTVQRLAGSSEPPSYRREPAGSVLDPLEPVIRELIDEWPDIKSPRVTEILRDEHGYAGSVDLVRKRIAKVCPPSDPYRGAGRDRRVSADRPAASAERRNTGPWEGP